MDLDTQGDSVMKSILIILFTLLTVLTSVSCQYNKDTYTILLEFKDNYGNIIDSVNTIVLSSNEQKESFLLSSSSEIDLKKDNDYILVFSKKGYLNEKLNTKHSIHFSDTIININFQRVAVVDFLPTIHFKMNEYVNNSDSAKRSLVFLSEILDNNDRIEIKIKSFIDSTEINNDLTLKRALFVKTELIKLGVDSTRLLLSLRGYVPFKNKIGYTPFKQDVQFDEIYINKLKPNLKEKARYYNRRIEFEVIPPVLNSL